MTTFTDGLKQFGLTVQSTSQAAFVNIVSAMQASIQYGSPVTGAPGQPVDTGALRASWQTSFESPTSAIIGTNLVYAPYIEEGVVPLGSRRGNATGNTSQRLTLRSSVGGFHSVALTVAGFDRIVEDEVRKLSGAA